MVKKKKKKKILVTRKRRELPRSNEGHLFKKKTKH